MKRLFLPILAVLALALPAAGPAATIAIKITATGFSPKTLTINQGDTVKWTNADTVNHQIVANNGAFASGILRPGATFSFTFNTSGKYGYHDALKPTLTGTITVKGLPPQVSVGLSTPIITYGSQTTISGQVSNGKPNEVVLILAQPFGSSPQQIATLMTQAGGSFTYSAAPALYTTYTAKWKTATSQTVTVQVRPQITLTRTSSTRFFAKVMAGQSHAGRFIYLQRHSAFGQWVTVGKLRLGPNSGRIFKVVPRKGTFVYRVYMTTNQAGTGYLESWSNSVRVRFRR
jgi:plastocyanin